MSFDPITYAAAKKAALPIGAVIEAALDPGADYIKLDGRSVSLASYPALADLKPPIGQYGVATDVRVPLGGKDIKSYELVYVTMQGLRIYRDGTGKLHYYDSVSKTLKRCDFGGADAAWTTSEKVFNFQSDNTGRVTMMWNSSATTGAGNKWFLSSDGGKTFAENTVISAWGVAYSPNGAYYTCHLGAPGEFLRTTYAGTSGQIMVQKSTDLQNWTAFATLSPPNMGANYYDIVLAYLPSAPCYVWGVNYYNASTSYHTIGHITTAGSPTNAINTGAGYVNGFAISASNAVFAGYSNSTYNLYRFASTGSFYNHTPVSYAPGQGGFCGTTTAPHSQSIRYMSLFRGRHVVWADNGGTGIGALDLQTGSLVTRGSVNAAGSQSLQPLGVQHIPYQTGDAPLFFNSYIRNTGTDATALDAREHLGAYQDWPAAGSALPSTAFDTPFLKRFGPANVADAWMDADGSLTIINGDTGQALKFATPFLENRFVNSEELSGATLAAVTLLTNRTANPVDGAENAEEVVENTGGGEHYIQPPSTTEAFPIETFFTVSCYLKKNAGVRSTVRVLGFAGGNPSYGVSGVVDLLTGAVSNVTTGSYISSGYTVTAADAGDGWWRVSITFRWTSSLGSSYAGIRVSTWNGASSFTGDGTSGFYIFGIQAKRGQPGPYVKSGGTVNAVGGRVTGPTDIWSVAPTITNCVMGAHNGAAFFNAAGVLYRSTDGISFTYRSWPNENPEAETATGISKPAWIGSDYLGRMVLLDSTRKLLRSTDDGLTFSYNNTSVVVSSAGMAVAQTNDKTALYYVALNTTTTSFYRYSFETDTQTTFSLTYFIRQNTSGSYYPYIRSLTLAGGYLFAVFSFTNDSAARELWRVPLATLATTTSTGGDGQGAAMGWIKVADLKVDPDALVGGNGVLVIARDNDLFYSGDGGTTFDRATVNDIPGAGFHTITQVQYDAAANIWLATGLNFMAVSSDGQTWQRAVTEPSVTYAVGALFEGQAVAADNATGVGGRMYELVDNTTEVVVPALAHPTAGIAYFMKGR